MSLKIGIVGLPNVGKSTLFNALTRTSAAAAENYPFCTIDPNIGIVEVPDYRLKLLAEVSKSEKVIPAIVEFVDIAGLVKGASEGQGLGNKFLSNIRECSAIAHIIRTFNDPNVIHVHGKIDPKIDREVIEAELILSDLQTLEKRLYKANSDAKSGEKEKKDYADLLEKVKKNLESGVLAIDMGFDKDQLAMLDDLHFLTMKQTLYILNVSEDEIGHIDKQKYAEKLGISDLDRIIPICARIEQDLLGFGEEEAGQYLKSLGLETTGLNALIQAAYKTLGLITYFTSGPTETRAWTIKKGYLAPQAAGVIHTDFEKGFIKTEAFNWKDFVEAGGEAKAKEKGLMRIEGKDYIVKDGDTMHFKFAL